MTLSTHISDLIPAYALGSLDPDEAAEVQAHLATCESCRAELRAYEDVMADLALSVPQVAPPPELKRQILTAVASPAPALSLATSPESWWRRLLAGLRTPAYAFAAVAAVVVLALLVSNITLLTRVRTLETEVAMSGPLQTITLNASDVTPDARAILVLSEDGKRGALIVDDLPPLDDTHEYQLWLITPDGKRDSGAVFSVDAGGYASIMVSNPMPLKDYVAFGVTIEPAGGSPGPTGPNVLKGKNTTG